MGTDRNNQKHETIAYVDLTESAIEVIEEGLTEITFGEYLVHRKALTRPQLLAALCEQDQHDGISLHEIIAWLGYASYAEIDVLVTEWSEIPIVEIM